MIITAPAWLVLNETDEIVKKMNVVEIRETGEQRGKTNEKNKQYKRLQHTMFWAQVSNTRIKIYATDEGPKTVG